VIRARLARTRAYKDKILSLVAPPGSPPSRWRQTVDLVRIRKIAVGEPERIAAGDHRVAILEFDEAAIHRAACDDNAKLAFPAMPIPAINVRLLAHERLPSVPRSSTRTCALKHEQIKAGTAPFPTGTRVPHPKIWLELSPPACVA
jgi:hypothetical protein